MNDFSLLLIFWFSCACFIAYGIRLINNNESLQPAINALIFIGAIVSIAIMLN